MIFQNHTIKGSGDFIGTSQSKQTIIRHSGSGDIMVFVYYVTLQNHVIKLLNDFMVRSPSRYVTILPSLAAMGPVMVDIS